jgi:hypothetical protein
MFIINGKQVECPNGIVVKNYIDASLFSPVEPKFKCSPRKQKLEHFVLHETAGRSAKGCKDTLIKKGYGVHLILDRDGTLTCHGDLATDVMVHANQLNATSIGIEVVNPYAPMLAKGMKDIEYIPAEWWTWCPKDPTTGKIDKRYVLPTKIQLATLKVIVPFLCEQLGIPYEFPTKDLNAKQQQVKPVGLMRKMIPGPGIVAHRDFAKHSDGRYLLEWLMKN